MSLSLIVILGIVVIVGVVWSNQSNKNRQRELERTQLNEARADAERWTERLGSQVLTMSGSDTASQQAIADASERFTAAQSGLARAQTVKEFRLARESALEGLHYINAAREIMGMPLGPELPALEGQRQAGKVTEKRSIDFEGQTITASPSPSQETPNYYPGGNVAGKPVPAGWYSTPWWASAMATGMWNASSIMMFSMMFSGMAGAPSAAAFESGYEEGFADAQGDFDGDGDMGADIGSDDIGGGDDGGLFGGDGGLFGGDGDFFGDGFDFDF